MAAGPDGRVWVALRGAIGAMDRDGRLTTYGTDGLTPTAIASGSDGAMWFAAGDKLWGGADVINQYLAAGLLDELELHITPVLVGGGGRLFDNLGAAVVRLEQVRAVEAPGVTHVRYRVLT